MRAVACARWEIRGFAPASGAQYPNSRIFGEVKHLRFPFSWADEGSMRVGGTELAALSARELGECCRRTSVGVGFQLYSLVFDLAVRESIEVCPSRQHLMRFLIKRAL